MIDYSIGAGACANVQRKNAVPTMIDTMPVFRFLPGEVKDGTEDERDYLFLVIEDIVSICIVGMQGKIIIISRIHTLDS